MDQGIEFGDELVISFIVVLCAEALETPLEAVEIVAELFGLRRGEVVVADLEDRFFDVGYGFVAFGFEREDKLESI